MLQIEGDYGRDGYAVIRQCVSQEIARALMTRIQKDSKIFFVPDQGAEPHDMLKRTVFELYGNNYPVMQSFLWGLTGMMEQITGKDLLPTFDFFRLYRADDICRVHRDRPACEHSLSLTLAYSDGVPWPLELGLGTEERDGPSYADDFGIEEFRSISMNVGDALAYRGPQHRHGRTTPNPNRWSGHLFLFWVEKGGPHTDQAFDQETNPNPVDFTFY